METMTPQEICERLKAEFPDMHVSLALVCNSHPHGVTSVRMWINCQGTGLIDCTSVAEGIRLLNRKPGHAVEPPVGADVAVPA